MSRPRISVCITHYNRPESLGATLESLAKQTLQPDEIFLWDDCSPKDPTPILEQWLPRFPQMVYYRNEVNLGMPGNLNAVVAQATGDEAQHRHPKKYMATPLVSMGYRSHTQGPLGELRNAFG